MPAEPERNIEKDLKAYAQQRRAASGAQPDLHPATRKLLQSEAAQLAKSTGKAQSTSGWKLWGSWPRLVISGVATLAVVAMCVLLFPGLSKAKYKSSATRMDLAANQDRLREEPAAKPMSPSPSPAPVMAEEKQPLAGATAKRSGAVTRKAESKVATATFDDINGGSLNAPAGAPAATPPATPPPAKAFAATSALSLADTPFSSSAYSTAKIQMTAEQQKDFSLYFAETAVAPVIQAFKKADVLQNPAQPSGRASAETVLTSFRVEQALDKLRMVDLDGSVYAGFVTQTPETGKPVTVPAKKMIAQDGLKNTGDAVKPIVPVRFYRFRVSGTNRTLNKDVVFTGNFLINDADKLSKEMTLTNGFGGGATSPTAIPALPLDLRKSRLEGRVLLGNSNQIEINAMPVKP